MACCLSAAMQTADQVRSGGWQYLRTPKVTKDTVAVLAPVSSRLICSGTLRTVGLAQYDATGDARPVCAQKHHEPA